jgi:cytochrome P450
MIDQALPHTLWVGAAILFLPFVFLFTKDRKSRISFPSAVPFPFNQTVLSEIFYILLTSDTFTSFQEKSRKRFGDVFLMGPLLSQGASKNTVCVLNPEDQAAVLRQEKYLEWTVSLPEAVDKIHGYNNIQRIPTGPKHAALRKVFSSILSPKSLQAFSAIIIDEFSRMWTELDEKQGEEVEIMNVIRHALLKLMCEILFDMKSDTEEGKEIFDEFSKDFVLVEKSLYAFYMKGKLFTDGFEASKRIKSILYDRFDSIFEERLMVYKNKTSSSEGNGKEYSDVGSAMQQIADALIQSGCEGKEDNLDGDLSYMEARDNLYLLLEGGHQTTMHVTTSMFYFLNHSDNKKILKRVRDEVSVVEPTYQGLKNFAFGSACVQETMRLSPITGAVVYNIKEGKSLKLRGETMHGPMSILLGSSSWYRSSSAFDDAKCFLPERWLRGDEKEVSKFARSIFRPFGFGRHICLGYPLANLVMNARLYCFAANRNRSIVYDEEKIKLKADVFPESQVSHKFLGKVVCNAE